jgi:hypothetical protein
MDSETTISSSTELPDIFHSAVKKELTRKSTNYKALATLFITNAFLTWFADLKPYRIT